MRSGLLLSAMLLGALCWAGDEEIDARIRQQDRPVAPSLEGASAWINMEKPLAIGDLKGKIVLMDFWTFG